MKRFWPLLLLILAGCGSGDVTIQVPFVRLFYVGSGTGKILSATSADGVNFTEESGTRFEKTGARHPDLFEPVSNQFVLFTTKENRLFKATADSMNSTFTEETTFDWDKGGNSSTHAITATGQDESGKTTTTIVTFHCADGIIKRSNYSTSEGSLSVNARALVNSHGSGVICDPTVIKKEDGTFLMFYRWAPSETSTDAAEQKIYAAESSDGLDYTAGVAKKTEGSNFKTVATNVVRDQASAPSAVKTNSSKVYLYVQDGTGSSSSGLIVGISKDQGENFSFQSVAITGLSTAKAQDPHAVQLATESEEVVP
ncbi:MAG: hypothetical protein HYS22_05930 [Deltaproteobacteria bacterium]|nr:hypothetical protein [Deltaproteobacteria bacterium]